MEEMLSTREIAQRFDMGEPTARGWARRGLLVGAFQIGRTWVVPSSALDGFKPPKRGRPKKKVGAQER